MDTVYVFSPMELNPEEYRKKYPELLTIPEFSDISNKMLMFIWWVYNPTSPYYLGMIPLNKRIGKAIDEVYGNDITPEMKEKLLTQDFDSKTRLAIERMGKLKWDARQRAKDMVDKIFDSFEELLDKPLSDFKDERGQIDTNAYMKIRNDIIKQLPEIITTKELGFGITSLKDNKKIEQQGQKTIETYLKNKKG